MICPTCNGSGGVDIFEMDKIILLLRDEFMNKDKLKRCKKLVYFTNVFKVVSLNVDTIF